METEGIGEFLNYFIGGFFLITSVTFLVSAWISNDRRIKIRRIIIGLIFMVLLIVTIYQKQLK
jgi:glycerol uptake facilitator-like aquaporin